MITCINHSQNLALLIDLETSEINVGESNGTVTLRLMANGKSEFDYNIDLIINDFSTGMWTLTDGYIVYTKANKAEFLNQTVNQGILVLLTINIMS